MLTTTASATSNSLICLFQDNCLLDLSFLRHIVVYSNKFRDIVKRICLIWIKQWPIKSKSSQSWPRQASLLHRDQGRHLHLQTMDRSGPTCQGHLWVGWCPHHDLRPQHPPRLCLRLDPQHQLLHENLHQQLELVQSRPPQCLLYHQDVTHHHH